MAALCSHSVVECLWQTMWLAKSEMFTIISLPTHTWEPLSVVKTKPKESVLGDNLQLGIRSIQIEKDKSLWVCVPCLADFLLLYILLQSFFYMYHWRQIVHISYFASNICIFITYLITCLWVWVCIYICTHTHTCFLSLKVLKLLQPFGKHWTSQVCDMYVKERVCIFVRLLSW